MLSLAELQLVGYFSKMKQTIKKIYIIKSCVRSSYGFGWTERLTGDNI